MNDSLQSKLSEVVGANNISYILGDNRDFAITGYKVMHNQKNSGLLRCAKIMYNGKIKLVYIIENNKPLSHVVTRLGVNELNAVIFNLIQRVMEIKANGFFATENLELDFDKIFVDTTDYSVHLIYFPVIGGTTGKISNFENEFRVVLISLFNTFPVFNAPQFQKLCSDLANGSLSLETILKRLQDNLNGNVYNQKHFEFNEPLVDYPPSKVPPSPVSFMKIKHQDSQHNSLVGKGFQGNVQQLKQPPLTITSLNSPMPITLTVNQPEYLIGKNPSAVNGAVTHNPAISRVHCKITYKGTKYYLTDMGSANGTFINQNRLSAQQTMEINSGDYIKLANSEFIVSF